MGSFCAIQLSFYLHLSKFCSEVLRCSKSFVFYNIDEITAKNKVKNDELVISVINHGIFLGEDEEHWSKEIYAVEFDDNNEIISNNSVLQMQSINCRVCGNYRNNRVISRI